MTEFQANNLNLYEMARIALLTADYKNACHFFILHPSINWDILELYQLHYASYQK